MSLTRIVSGGQTGVDRGALDAALAHSFPCGGWCPPGRQAEDGPIDAAYPLQEIPSGGYAERTRRNVEEADGTVVICFGELEGGTRLTVQECLARLKPCKLIDARETPEERAAELILHFVETLDIESLNVAGPRRSRVPRAQQYTRAVFEIVLDKARAAGTQEQASQ